ncbi:MAG: hypothetical protein IPI06_15950 [Gammaproteobacteria bacterium]|nr:hypothetical protein [Gammaproteobacteria bacterium]
MSQPLLGFLIHGGSQTAARRFAGRARELGLRRREPWYCSRRWRAAARSLARALSVRAITLRRSIDRLVAAGIVERSPSARPARESNCISRPNPTDRRAALSLGHGTADAPCAALDPGERTQLRTLLERVKRNLSEPAPQTQRRRPAQESTHAS